jgi:SnoaL-like protein
MSIDLPGPLSAYFKAQNERAIDAMLAPFDEDASVKDEGHEHRGRPAIRSWMEDTTRRYGVSVEVKDVTDANGTTVVSGLVSGNFPGSPVLLDYTFTLSGAKITRMEIA